MKKQLIFLLMTFLTLFMSTEVYGQDYVGTWKCISSIDIQEGKSYTDYMKGHYLVVKADGTYSSTSDDIGSGSYTMQGDVFTAKNNHGVTITAVLSMSDGRLMMEGTTSGGVTFLYAFEKAEEMDFVGTWKCISSYDEQEGKSFTDYMKGTYLVVNADGTYSSTSEDMGSGSYTIKGSVFTAKNNHGVTITAVLSMSDGRLMMEGVTTGGVTFSYVFEKVEEIDFVGTWKCISSYDEQEGKSFTDYMKGQYLVVNADGTYSSTSEDMGSGSYTMQGDVFTAKNNHGVTITAVLSMSDGRLKMEGMTSGGVTFSYVFEKADNDKPEEPDEPDETTLMKNGLLYSVKSDGTLEVIGLDKEMTTADIPSTVNINGTNYFVTSIGDRAFDGRSDITYLSIPYSIKSIGEYAFINCGSNMTVNIEDLASWCLMELGNEHSSPLSSARTVMSNNVVLDRVEIPEGVPYIGNFTFYQCRGITSLIIPSSVKMIGSSAFEDCTGLTSVTLNEGLVTIGGSSFEGCSGLTTLTIPSTVVTIAINAFKNCMGLKEVYCYAESVPDTHEDAFDMTPTGSSTLYVPAGSVEAYKNSWPWSDFNNIVALGSTSDDDIVKFGGFEYKLNHETSTAEITNIYLRELGISSYVKVSIPESVEYNGSLYTITSIGAYATQDGGGFWEGVDIIIPNTVKSIGSYAFQSCEELDVTLPESISYLYADAFAGKIHLSLHLNGLSNWCNIQFENEKSNPLSRAAVVSVNGKAIGDFVIPEGVSSIPSYAFMGNAISTITIPESITSINKYAFGHCYRLTDFYCYSESVPITDLESFDLETIKKVILHVPAGSVEAYKNSWPWSDFKEIVPLTGDDPNPGRKRTIHVAQAGTLSDYINIDDRYLIEDLTLTGEINGVDFRLLRNMAGKSYEFVIRDNRFYGSDTGGKLYVLDLSGVKIVAGGDYMHWDYNIDYEYDLSLEHDDEIPPYVFCGCIGLTSIIFPNSVTIIGDNTFYECTGLRMIKLGSGVKEIGYGAFANILKLNETTRSDDDYLHIYCEAEEVPTISSDAFTGTDMSRVVLHVPENLVNEYKASEVWSEVGTIEELSGTGIKAITNKISEAQIYDLQGNRLNNVRKGLNIIRMSDGKVKKVIVK